MQRAHALVIERDASVRAAIREVLERRGVVGQEVESGEEALRSLRGRPVQIVLVDIETAGPVAAELAAAARHRRPPPWFVALAADEEAVAAASRMGIVDHVAKPVARTTLAVAIERALQQVGQASELLRLQEQRDAREGLRGFVGRSPAMEQLRARLADAADGDRPVWISGEAGTGKEAAARELHASCWGAGCPFRVVRGGGPLVPEPGTATDAERPGATYFLRALDEVPADAQERLLDALRGDVAWRDARSTRLVVGTRRDPARAVGERRVLPEVADWLRAVHVEVPPLRERGEDLLLLTRHFLQIVGELNSAPPLRVAREVVQAFERHDWPGNVRELQSVLEHAALIARDGTIEIGDLPLRIAGGLGDGRRGLAVAADRSFRDAKRAVVASFEQDYLRDLLERHRGNVTAASRRAGMLRSALQRLLRKYDLRSSDFRGARPGPRASAAVPAPRAEG